MTVNPDRLGRWDEFGGRYVPETLIPALDELEAAYTRIRRDESFQEELAVLQRTYIGRPTPLYYARNLTRKAGGARIYLKREDLTHTGAHKINNTVGQILLASRMGKHRVVAETGAGQHGVATATACALAGISCRIYMGERDMTRQEVNVRKMRLLGAEVVPVTGGSAVLKDAINEAIRDWITNVTDTFYCMGSVVGPHPYPLIVRNFQAVIGTETRSQFLESTGRLPDVLIACVGGGSNAMGLFYPFLDDDIALIGVEAGGTGPEPGAHSASLTLGRPGILHGTRSYLLQDGHGQVLPADSISAGLDYPGVGPEHAWLKKSGRAAYTTVTDAEALEAFHLLTREEGIIPALESSHAVARALTVASERPAGQAVIAGLSGRGDKDLDILRSRL
ncbi:tryptophan synthase subunit beta [bacterium]|nr:tryptophan synthase subunit beta [bacterium]